MKINYRKAGKSIFFLLIAVLSSGWGMVFSQEISGTMSDLKEFRIGVHFIVPRPPVLAGRAGLPDYSGIFSRLWQESGRKAGFSVLETRQGPGPEAGIQSVSQLTAQNVDAIVIMRLDPASAVPTQSELEEIGVPVLLCGYGGGEIGVPFVGFDNYGDGLELGRKAAEIFKDRTDGESAKIISAGFAGLESAQEQIRGFIEGFKALVPDMELVEKIDTHGTSSVSLQTIQAMLTKYPDVNVLFGGDENSTTSILASFMEPADRKDHAIIVAGFAGSKDSILNAAGNSISVDVLAILPFRSLVERSAELLTEMLETAGAGVQKAEYLVGSVIIVDPTQDSVQEYVNTAF